MDIFHASGRLKEALYSSFIVFFILTILSRTNNGGLFWKKAPHDLQ